LTLADIRTYAIAFEANLDPLVTGDIKSVSLSTELEYFSSNSAQTAENPDVEEKALLVFSLASTGDRSEVSIPTINEDFLAQDTGLLKDNAGTELASLITYMTSDGIGGIRACDKHGRNFESLYNGGEFFGKRSGTRTPIWRR